jgi:hypothetical protein
MFLASFQAVQVFTQTNDERLTLTSIRHSLEPEALALWDELRRRKLTDPRRRLCRMDEVPFRAQNAACNTPANIAARVMRVGLVGLALTYLIAAAKVHQLGIFVVACVLIWGPIFLFIAWATRRALRQRAPSVLKNQRH